VALMLGCRLPLNVKSSYKALNITDFWRRWHIALSSWLRDYLYIPLGGNRHGKLNTYKNLMLTMLLGGLWHGAAWQFIFWGGMHGIGLAAHKLWMEILGKKPPTTLLAKLFWWFVTFHFVCFCWVFFAASDMQTGWTMLTQIGTNFYWNLVPEIFTGYWNIFAVIAFGMITHLLPGTWKDFVKQSFIQLPDLAKAAVMAVVAIGLYQVMSAEIQPFIYFQF
jgi:D-alanyl-lipoteichoic acid acyltransferase DltB (MBOAT superfamily)